MNGSRSIPVYGSSYFRECNGTRAFNDCTCFQMEMYIFIFFLRRGNDQPFLGGGGLCVKEYRSKLIKK